MSISLGEVLVAVNLLATGLVGLAQLLVMCFAANASAKHTTIATVLAEQKVEEIRALPWGDPGLTPSSRDTLYANALGYVDFVDRWGAVIDAGSSIEGDGAPEGAMYVRRWAIEPWPVRPAEALVVHVRVSRVGDRNPREGDATLRRPDVARIEAVRARRTP